MMNERITELRKKSWDLVQIDLQTNERDEPISEREHTKMVFDKFAELIVQECVDYAFANGDNVDYLKQYFGVE
jgi:hypothetical protein